MNHDLREDKEEIWAKVLLFTFFDLNKLTDHTDCTDFLSFYETYGVGRPHRGSAYLIEKKLTEKAESADEYIAEKSDFI